MVVTGNFMAETGLYVKTVVEIVYPDSGAISPTELTRRSGFSTFQASDAANPCN
jgi:hypothetical protein